MPEIRALTSATAGSVAPAPRGSVPQPVPSAQGGRAVTQDALSLSSDARARLTRRQQDAELPAEDTRQSEPSLAIVATDLAPVFDGLRRVEKSPFAIQEVRFADLVAGGRETHMVFERESGTLMPAVPSFFKPQVDPLTGVTNLALREARLRVSAGRYDIIVELDGDGRPSFHKLMLDGRDITRIAGDWVKGKIQEDPAVWGTAAVVAAAGAVAAAHAHVGRTGRPIGFGLGNVKLYEGEHMAVRLKPRAELTGDSRFVRATGAELGATYHDGPLRVSGGVRYHAPQRTTEVVATMGYQVNPTTTLSAYATHNTQTRDTTAGILLLSTF